LPYSGFGLRADKAIDRLAVPHNHNGRQTTHTELLGDALLVVAIHFRQQELTGVFVRQFFQHRHQGFTRRAPFRPEIDDHRPLKRFVDQHFLGVRHSDGNNMFAHALLTKKLLHHIIRRSDRSPRLTEYFF
jgi:hypothetical protein